MLEQRDWPEWRGRRVCIDTETFDPNLKTTGPSVRTGGYVLGVSVALEDGPAFYLPVRHNGGNVDQDPAWFYLQDQAKYFEGTLVGMNLSYDLDWLAHEGVHFNRSHVMFRDVMVAEALLNEHHKSYSLQNIGTRWVGEGKDDGHLLSLVETVLNKSVKDARPYLKHLSGLDVAPYAEQDVKLPLKVLRLQEEEIKKQDLQEVWDLESRLLPVLVAMKRRGVRVDQDRLAQVEEMAEKRRVELAEYFNHLTGAGITHEDAMKRALLVPALRDVGVPIGEGISLDKDFLAAHADNYEACDVLKSMRSWNTLLTLCVNPVKEHMVDGRIHCNFRQLTGEKYAGKRGGAKYGRMSCEHVNMQQQPARDEEIGPLWRRIYLPEEDHQWALLDYSQQEPRILVHYADLLGLTGAKEAANRYRTDPDTDMYQMLCEMANITRKEAKIIYLGLSYGMGGGKLCHSLGLPVRRINDRVYAGREGRVLFDKFHTNVPFIRQFTKYCEQRAKTRGSVKTLMGRKCRFPTRDLAHKAGNRVIQGGAADQTKAALVALDEAGFFLQLQVHDEIDMSIQYEWEAKRAAELMRDVIDLQVPMKVDVEIGPSWGEAK